MFARVRVTGLGRYAALLVPDEAIGTDQTNKYVYIVADDGTVARRNVTLGPLVSGLRVVREGHRRRRLGDHQGTAARAAGHQGRHEGESRSQLSDAAAAAKSQQE